MRERDREKERYRQRESERDRESPAEPRRAHPLSGSFRGTRNRSGGSQTHTHTYTNKLANTHFCDHQRRESN